MMLTALLSVLLVAIAAAAPQEAAFSTSIESKETCITKYKPTLSRPARLPVKTKTSAQTVISTTTTCGGSSTTTVTVTPSPITSTVFVNATSSLLASDSFSTLTVTASSPCSLTTTISVGTTTVFTGSYNGTVAKRTAGLLDNKQRSPAAANVFHRFGQSALGERQKAFAVVCMKQVTTYLITTSTIAEEPATETVTLSTSTVYVTSTNKVPSGPTAPASGSTTTTFAEGSGDSGVCTVTSASSTTTQHLKCAPTNLISSVNGYGIAQTDGESTGSRGLADGSDPSACCQMCVDDDECAASEDDPDAANCFLWYTTPSCGLGFRYSDGGQKLAPGTGFLVQTGCGGIEAVDSF